MVLLRHCNAAFIKHVFPILLKPHKPGLLVLNECFELEFLTLEFEENPLKGENENTNDKIL